MDSSLIVNSLGIGGAIFLVLLMVWFVAVYMKRRVGPDQLQTSAASLHRAAWEEKRERPRLAVSWMASVDGGQGAMNAMVKDVSRGGAFVVSKNPLPLKTRLAITLQPAAQRPLVLNAEVIWSNINVPADKVINRGMGIRFIDNDEGDRNRLNQLIVAGFKDD